MSSPSSVFPDHINAVSGAVSDWRYRAGGGSTAALHYLDSATGSRVVYWAMGLESVSDFFWRRSLFPSALRSHNSILAPNRGGCWQVLDTKRATCERNRSTWQYVQSKRRADDSHPGLTRGDGTFEINGVEPDSYEVSAAKPGFVIQRRPLVTTHGGFRDRITFLMVKAEPAIIRGKVTKLDGTTPVVGATAAMTRTIL